MSKQVDYLDEDVPISGQNYVLLSFISQKQVKNAKHNAVKIRGVFPDIESAKQYAKKLQEIDGDFHVYVAECFKWLVFDPDEELIDNQEYYEKELNEIMKTNKEQMLEIKKIEKERKDQIIKENYEESKEPLNETHRRLREKAAKKKLNNLLEKKEEITEESAKNIDILSSGLNKLNDVYALLKKKQDEMKQNEKNEK